MILGANWIYTAPTHIKLDLFVFKAALGGIANDFPELRAVFRATHSDSIRTILNTTFNNYPECGILFRSIDHAFEIVIGGYIYDYDLFVAQHLEKQIASLITPASDTDSLLLRKAEWERLVTPVKFDRFKEDNIKTVGGYFTTTKINSQQFYLAFRCELGCSCEIFEHDIRKILDAHDLDFGEYSELEDSVLISIGNGRQGVNGVPIRHTDPEKLEADINVLVAAGKFNFGINKKFIHADEYTKLTNAPTRFIKMKTEDFDFIMSKNFQE